MDFILAKSPKIWSLFLFSVIPIDIPNSHCSVVFIGETIQLSYINSVLHIEHFWSSISCRVTVIQTVSVLDLALHMFHLNIFMFILQIYFLYFKHSCKPSRKTLLFYTIWICWGSDIIFRWIILYITPNTNGRPYDSYCIILIIKYY